jgi:deoxyribodipyrimidine photo-lyase
VKRFKKFTQDRLMLYAGNSNQPQTDDVSHMSPYLHFGQISPVYLALEVKKFLKLYPQDTEAYLEQLIVRRELAMNFAEFSKDYDTFTSIPVWAKKTLKEHASDSREYLYTPDKFERAQTHDEYWNAAMNEMKITGFMHNYMRMYWGKKVLEWSISPEEAFNTLMCLNNKYFLDGRDANSYTGVAWIFGLHDRAWGRREVFGTVRYMAASGLERKCDIKAYVKKIDQLKQNSNPL